LTRASRIDGYNGLNVPLIELPCRLSLSRDGKVEIQKLSATAKEAPRRWRIRGFAREERGKLVAREEVYREQAESI
jgi:hypothetical protein